MRFLILLQDIDGEGEYEAITDDGVKVTIINWDGILTGAKIGYRAMFAKIDGNWYFCQGKPIT